MFYFLKIGSKYGKLLNLICVNTGLRDILFIFLCILSISSDLNMPMASFLETCVLGTSHQKGFQNQSVLFPLSICQTNPCTDLSTCTCLSVDCVQTGWLSSSSFLFGKIKTWRKCLCPQTMQKAYTLFAVAKGNWNSKVSYAKVGTDTYI